MPTFKIWHVGSRELSIEEGSSMTEACEKTGWRLEECEVEMIPESQIIRYGEPLAEGLKLDVPAVEFGYVDQQDFFKPMPLP